MLLDICICTHNPRRDVLRRVVESISNQDSAIGSCFVLVIDNASGDPITDLDCQPLTERRIPYRIVQENRLGNVFARQRAIAESKGKWVLFVDDDNELSPNYIMTGLEIIKTRKDIGCFGGKLLLPEYIQPRKWIRPLLPYLGILDHGEIEITRVANHWGPWEPPTAGAFICRPLLKLYLERTVRDSRTQLLGRKGTSSLTSCEDSLMMRGAHELGLANSYQPRLALTHHINVNRLRFSYLMRLMYAYGRSHVILGRICGQAFSNKSRSIFPFLAGTARYLFSRFLVESIKHSVRYAACMSAYRIGWIVEEQKDF